MKQEEIIKLSDVELKNNITVFEDKLSKMSVSHKVTPIENPLQIRFVRRTIARFKTELGKRVQA
jgi:large subunit ribosomal protein L29